MTNVGIPGSPPGDTPTTVEMKITERFTRTDDDTIQYEMSVEDPEILTTGKWSAAFPMKLDNDYQMFEYACHEGNYGVANILRAARVQEANGQTVDAPVPFNRFAPK